MVNVEQDRFLRKGQRATVESDARLCPQGRGQSYAPPLQSKMVVSMEGELDLPRRHRLNAAKSSSMLVLLSILESRVALLSVLAVSRVLSSPSTEKFGRGGLSDLYQGHPVLQVARNTEHKKRRSRELQSQCREEHMCTE
eukprot:2481038-Amphidinium_carterae.1